MALKVTLIFREILVAFVPPRKTTFIGEGKRFDATIKDVKFVN